MSKDNKGLLFTAKICLVVAIALTIYSVINKTLLFGFLLAVIIKYIPSLSFPLDWITACVFTLFLYLIVPNFPLLIISELQGYRKSGKNSYREYVKDQFSKIHSDTKHSSKSNRFDFQLEFFQGDKDPEQTQQEGNNFHIKRNVNFASYGFFIYIILSILLVIISWFFGIELPLTETNAIIIVGGVLTGLLCVILIPSRNYLLSVFTRIPTTVLIGFGIYIVPYYYLNSKTTIIEIELILPLFFGVIPGVVYFMVCLYITKAIQSRNKL